MIDFFAVMFLIGLIGFIIFSILTIIFKHEITACLVFVCFIIVVVAGIGMEVEKSKEPQDCNCPCCSVCDAETAQRR